MTKHLTSISACILVLGIAGCAAPKPVPFQLVNSESKVHQGTLFPDNQRIEVKIDGQLYQGFYMVATGQAHSESFGGWRSTPRETVTTYSSNSVRAQLISENGQRLRCEFLFEGRRAIGECRSLSGTVFQLIANGD
jgi:hypothetical protein